MVDFGKINFVRSQRATRISVKILPDSLVITLPPRCSEKEAMIFVDTVCEKIVAKQQKIKEKTQANSLFIDENTDIKTLTFNIKIIKTSRENIFFHFTEKTLTIEVPQSANFHAPEIQKTCWRGIDYFLRKEAKRILPQRLTALAEKYGFQFSSVKIQSSTSRWGSCSAQKTINLSFYLLLLPPPLVDYVLLHELCHTREMNHSPHFWAEMNKVTDNQAKTLRAEIRKFSMPRFFS